jgi:hypothetical protein
MFWCIAANPRFGLVRDRSPRASYAPARRMCRALSAAPGHPMSRTWLQQVCKKRLNPAQGIAKLVGLSGDLQTGEEQSCRTKI